VSTARVDFTRGAAERIAAVVRQVEGGNRDGAPLKFGRATDSSSGGGVLRIGTFTGAWPIGEQAVVTLQGSTATARVLNLCVPLVADATTRTVVFGRAKNLPDGTATTGGNVAVEIESAGVCGKYQGPFLINFGFESCFGDGAAGRVTEPGGEPGEDDGPISAIELTSGGGGYALRARTSPTLSVTGDGIGASFTVTTSEVAGDCGIPHWKITSATVKGGTGYVQGEALTVGLLENEFEEVAASLTLNTVRAAPTLTATVQGGAGASLTVTSTSNGGSPETFSITAISVGSGGSGYSDRAAVSIVLGSGDVEQAPAAAIARTVRTQPTITATAQAGGTGASLTVSLTQSTDGEGRPVWGVSSVGVSSGGTGYAVNDQITFVVTVGQVSSLAAARVSTVGGSGEITAVVVDAAGEAFVPSGQVDVVVLTSGGTYYKESPSTVTVNNGGKYYRETGGAPYVAGVTVTINQISPSAGSSGVVTASVDASTASPTFGQISSLSIANAGTAYLAWEWKYRTPLGNLDLSTIAGYVGDEEQLLGHDDGACLKWFSVTTCGTATSSP
jgi:hypothetical protein